MKGRVDFVIPECYIDTNLVETLACPGGYNHQKGCNQVAKIMQEKFNKVYQKIWHKIIYPKTSMYFA